jgi:YesN/AraC family two-component response regulator
MITDQIKSDYRILVVDDSEFSRSQIIKMLKANKFNVVGEANSAEMCLKIIREKKPHLVLTDVVMPENSGIELAEKISKTYDSVSVIVFSSLKHEQIVMEAIKAGALDFIQKPIDETQLIESIEKLISSSQNEY